MNNNPFVLPGFGQAGPMGQNPILASMEMMRQAWDGIASSGGMDPAAMGRMMSVEEMDKRIADLRAVENWLRMNLSMLTSTIQGLEVQRATVATLKSFVDSSMAAGAPSPAKETGGAARGRQASPLDEVLGIRPGAEAPARQAAEPPPSSAQAPDPGAGSEPESDAASQTEQSDILSTAASATQGWWSLLQQQFQTLAAATAASAEGAMSDLAEAGKAAAETQAAAAGVAQPGRTAAARKATAKKTAAAGAPTGRTEKTPVASRAPAKTAAKAAGTARKTRS